MNIKFSPEQKAAWRAEQKLKPKWRTLYGWTGVPAFRPTGQDDIHGKPLLEQLPFPQHYQRAWSAEAKEVVLGAPIRAIPANAGAKRESLRDALAKAETLPERDKIERSIVRLETRIHQSSPVRYIVWHDRTLRSVDNVFRSQFGRLKPDEQLAMIQQAKAA